MQMSSHLQSSGSFSFRIHILQTNSIVFFRFPFTYKDGIIKAVHLSLFPAPVRCGTPEEQV